MSTTHKNLLNFYSEAECIINEVNHFEEKALVWVYRSFYNRKRAESMFQTLKDEINWGKYQMMVGDKLVTLPRLTAAMNIQGFDQGFDREGGFKRQPLLWDKNVLHLMNNINEVFDCHLNSALLSLYRDKNDYIAYHSDKEVAAPRYYVWGLSLGQSRPFYFKRKKDGEVIATEVHSGDLMLMEAETQKLFLHSVPKRTAKNVDWTERISITYRELN